MYAYAAKDEIKIYRYLSMDCLKEAMANLRADCQIIVEAEGVVGNLAEQLFIRVVRPAAGNYHLHLRVVQDPLVKAGWHFLGIVDQGPIHVSRN